MGAPTSWLKRSSKRITHRLRRRSPRSGGVEKSMYCFKRVRERQDVTNEPLRGTENACGTARVIKQEFHSHRLSRRTCFRLFPGTGINEGRRNYWSDTVRGDGEAVSESFTHGHRLPRCETSVESVRENSSGSRNCRLNADPSAPVISHETSIESTCTVSTYETDTVPRRSTESKWNHGSPPTRGLTFCVR